jgi:uncharacterized membrane protein/Mg-chelatase subunit ChlD
VAAAAVARVIQFTHPEALLLVLLAWLVLRRHAWPRPLLGILRNGALLAIATLLAGPSWPGAEDGRDVVLVVDRSASMPDGSVAKARELAQQVAGELLPGDRLGVVTFGRKPVVDSVPQTPFVWPDATQPLDADASDLGAALGAASALVPPGRQGSLLVVSDGEHTSGDLDAAARQCRRQGLRVDAILAPRRPGADCAVIEVQTADTVPRGEPFALSAVVVATRAAPARWRLLVDGADVARGDADLTAGRNVLQFRHTLAEAGQHDVVVEVTTTGDARPENDRAATVVRATSPPRYLCVTPAGRDDRLTQALRTAGAEVVVAAAETAPLTLAQLDGFRVVVLENVPATALPAGAMRVLQQWVHDLGGGLLMTGGKASFGVGGYHRSPLEDVLPITLEIREEQRRFGLAMAIALDCSGSMRAQVGAATKMELASRGAASAIELLSPIDGVAVLAVDTEAHSVVPMQAVEDKAALAAQARTITVRGGGIYVGKALHAAAEELARAPQQHKHLVLFADAADAEEAEDYTTFVPQLVQQGITVSVIGLGKITDEDAALLERVAELGQGRCQFVADANDLPRVFAQETIQVARSSVVETPTTILAQPGLAALGDMPPTFPVVGGYAMAWLRPRAELALTTGDDQHAPFLSYWQVGLGRTAAYLGEVDGELSGELASWPRFGEHFATLVRWLQGGQVPGLFVSATRHGGSALFRLEIEPERAAMLDGARGVLSPPGGPATELAFAATAPGRLEARVPLLRSGVYRGAVQLGTQTVALPPMCLPYSPEFALEPDPRAGERALQRLVRATGGSMEPGIAAILAGERRSAGAIDLGPAFAWLLVAMLLAEIAVRRLQLTLPMPAWLQRWSARFGGAATPVPVDAIVVSSTRDEPPSPPPDAAPPDATAADGGLLGALSRAKRRSGRT